MRRFSIVIALGCLAGLSTLVEGAEGRVLKVLPHFLDLEGRYSTSPDFYQRDVYQAYLRAHPENRSGIRYDVQWKAKGPTGTALMLRVELRGITEGYFPKQLVLERPFTVTGR